MAGLVEPAQVDRLPIPSLTVVDSPDVVTPLTVPGAARRPCTDLAIRTTYVDAISA
jgi:hypothetical protein